MRKSKAAAHPHEGEHHHNHHLLEKTEGGMDFVMLGIIVALGLAMAIGLATVGGDASWIR